MNVKFETGDLMVEAELFDTLTGQNIYDCLPIKVTVQTWGDEIYFELDVSRELDDSAVETVNEGDLGYWPTGRAMCIFFGPTPTSAPGEIRPASAVNIIGRVKGDAKVFKQIPAGAQLTVSPA